MIVAVVVFLIGGEPVVTLRSRADFPDGAACAAFVAAEAGNHRRAAAALSARAGRPVAVRAGCVSLPRGVRA